MDSTKTTTNNKTRSLLVPYVFLPKKHIKEKKIKKNKKTPRLDCCCIFFSGGTQFASQASSFWKELSLGCRVVFLCVDHIWKRTFDLYTLIGRRNSIRRSTAIIVISNSFNTHFILPHVTTPHLCTFIFHLFWWIPHSQLVPLLNGLFPVSAQSRAAH